MNPSMRGECMRQRRQARQVGGFGAGLALVAALVGLNANAANPPSQATPAAPGPLAATPLPPLVASVSYTKIEVVLGESLAVARGGSVALGLQYRPNPVASVQVPGVLSYPIGPFPGGFDHSIGNADIRALLRGDEAQIVQRCQSTLDHNKADVIDTVHDTTIALNLHRADGSVAASTSVPYQLGLTCKRPLIVKVPHTRIGVDIKRTLAQASGGQVALALTYNGTRNVASLQFAGGAFSYPLGARQGPFEQTLPNADIRMMLARDEAAILDRCRSTLDYNRANVIDTVHDTRIQVTVNGADGAVVAATSVPYQLGLTCTR